ncbi:MULTISPECIES: CapA family protein [Colwellia]|uniref:Capsular polysaccharide biosynthesis protein n=1 Tax=Colwellia marinimaniae TaxID=1513592 RepID=A0ABQ0MZ92_9GAMM|nr:MULTISPECIES: CapA family protein [Colwellia]GAW97675.1 capsular polysaccharide biosynthesis protein [Colwellia marinimaniae]
MRQLITLIIILAALGFQPNVTANQSLSITGILLDESQQPLSEVNVTLNNKTVSSDKQGRFVMPIDSPVTNSSAQQAIYQLSFAKIDYFKSIQTFSHYELFYLSAENRHGVLADITLVAKKAKRVMLAFGGDVMMDRRYYKPYFGDAILIHPETRLKDSKKIVEHIKAYMSIADYAAVNLETQIADKNPGERAPKSVTFYSHPEILDALVWAGIDYVSLGNNHTYDYLEPGMASTIAFLQESPLDFSGAGMNEQQALKAHRQTINNTEFSMLAYVGWEGRSEPTQTANHQHGGAAYGSMANIISSVQQEVSQDRITIVQYHGSQEYASSPTGVTEQRLKSALDHGAALAIAHHPHVSQGLELYNNKLIAYSMGNFIFDQNFSATQHSFILYVWLDAGKFHRAEIVPLYVKGYKPTPATGVNRYTVMKRLTVLSKLRNTHISQSGGHGVITPTTASVTVKSVNINLVEPTFVKKSSMQHKLTFAPGSKIASLTHLPWHQQISAVSLPNEQVKYRLGKNLINGSDFEGFSSFDSPERGLFFDRSIMSLNNYGASGNTSMSLALNKQQTTTFGVKSFWRVYSASRPMTIKANYLSKNSVKLHYYWQGRKSRQKLFDAFKNSPKNLIKTLVLAGSDKWQSVEVDFNSPRVGYKSYRIMVEAELIDGSTTQLAIDDFAVIEWHSAFTDKATPPFFSLDSRQPAYLGLSNVSQLDKTSAKGVVVTTE